MSGIQATRLRFGFLDATIQFLHINNIKIINSFGQDIMLNVGTTVTPNSTSVTYQSPGDIKTILTDNNTTTFSHSELTQAYIKIDFDKSHTVSQIIMENRTGQNSVRILNAQFRLYNDKLVNDIMVYESNKITVDSPLYYLLPGDKTIFTGAAPLMAMASEPLSRKYALKTGLDQSGKTITPPGRLSNITVSDCQDQCNLNTNCAGIVYEPATKSCWTISGFDSSQVKNASYDTYIKSNPYDYGPGLDQNGKTITPPGIIANVDVETCQIECDKNPLCKGIVYRPSTKDCWTISGFDSQVKNALYDSYYKTDFLPFSRKVRVGFFQSGKKQFLHICNIRIINKFNLDITSECTFTQTSTLPGYENDLKKVLTDQDVLTFNHTTDAPNQYLTIDFGKNQNIKHIIIENRAGQFDRFIDAQIKLYDESDNLIYTSAKVTNGDQFYSVNLPSTAVNLGSFVLIGINLAVAAATLQDGLQKAAAAAKVLADKAKAETEAKAAEAAKAKADADAAAKAAADEKAAADAKNAEAAKVKAEADAAAKAAADAKAKAEADALNARTAAEAQAAADAKAAAERQATQADADKKAADDAKLAAEREVKIAADAKAAADAEKKAADDAKVKAELEAKAAADAKLAADAQVKAAEEQKKLDDAKREADEKALLLKKAQEEKEAADKLALSTPTPENTAKAAEAAKVLTILEEQKTKAEETVFSAQQSSNKAQEEKKQAENKASTSLSIASATPAASAASGGLGIGAIVGIVCANLLLIFLIYWFGIRKLAPTTGRS